MISKKHKALISQHSKYMGAKGNLENELEDKILFDFSIVYMEGGGFMVLNYETSSVAEIDKCITHIEENGTLGEDDHEWYCI